MSEILKKEKSLVTLKMTVKGKILQKQLILFSKKIEQDLQSRDSEKEKLHAKLLNPTTVRVYSMKMH